MANRRRITRRDALAGGAALGGLGFLGPSAALFAQTDSDGAGAFRDLEAALRGEVITPGEPGYDTARQVWNSMIDRHPAAISQCTGVADVSETIRFARRKALPVSVRGGGHNVAGKAVRDDAIMLDLSPINGVHVDPDARLARVGGGARWAAFDHETTAFGLATTGGTVSSTGVGGLTLGGGLGWLMRKHGLSCDNLVSADMVLADGRFVTASETAHEDLFWAIRGGGGNFGVVTSFEFRLHRLEPVTAGLAMYPGDRLSELLHFYRDYTAQLPNSVTTMAGAFNGPPGTPLEGQVAGWLALCHCGRPEEAERILEPVREFGAPALGGFGPMDYLALQTMFDAGAGTGNRHYWRSNFLPELPDDVIDIVVERAAEGLQGPGTMILFEQLGGAINDVADDATAFSNRAARHNVSILASWPDASRDEENIRWTRAFGDQIKAYSSGAGYVNYMTDDESAERVLATYEANLARLIEIKREYDPENFFNANQNIRP